jgi:hypothetical protein
MGRADEQAAEVEAVGDELAAFCRSCTPEEWVTIVPGEGWPVGVVCFHAANGNDGVVGWMQTMLEVGELTITPDDLDAGNAEMAAEHAGVTVDEAADLAIAASRRAATYLRGLTDAQLEATAPFGPAGGAVLSVAALAENVPRHPRSHLASAQAAVGRT